MQPLNTSTPMVFRILVVFTLLAMRSQASVQRDNEMGVSPTHSYTQVGPGEVVSNLNGNLVLTIPVADIASASPLGIHLERSYNSHWRDPLIVQQFDVVNKGGRAWRENPNWDWRDVRWNPADGQFVGGIFGRTNYDNPGKSLATGNAAVAAAMGISVTGAAWSIAETVHDLANLGEHPGGETNLFPDGVERWGAVGFAGASLLLQVNAISEHEGKWTTGEFISTSASMTYSVAVLTTALAWKSMTKAEQTAAKRAFATVGAALHLYQFARYQDEANPWDPGYETAQPLMALSLGLDLMGAALVWGPPPANMVGGVLMLASAVLDMAASIVAMVDASSARWDVGEVRVQPWALSVNGYVAMLGNKLPQDWGRAAYPFSTATCTKKGFGNVCAERLERSAHPIPDLYLVRSGGAADRFLLQPWDGGTRLVGSETEKWYAYQALGDKNRTLVYYCDRAPYQSDDGHLDNDPNDYYLVKEPDGTWARFGHGAENKGIDVQQTGWGDPFETYWALPNSIHHFDGDSVSIERGADHQIVAVRHSRDPRWVKIDRTGETEVAQVMRNGQSLTRQSIAWTTVSAGLQRHQPDPIVEQVPGNCGSSKSPQPCTRTLPGPRVRLSARMPASVSVPVNSAKSLMTRFAWEGGDLARVDYPDGAFATYEWYREKSVGPLDGFLHRRVQIARADGSGAKVEHVFGHHGWTTTADPEGTQGITEGDETGILYTDVTRTVSTPGPDGARATSTSATSRYRFQYKMTQVNVRNKPSGLLPLTPDTALSSYSQVGTARLQLLTAWDGLEGSGTRTDYIWEGDKLRMTVRHPALDSGFTPEVVAYHYDRRGTMVAQQKNPADLMGRLEWTALLTLGSSAKEVQEADSTTTREELKARIIAHLGKDWKARLDTLDRTEVFAWHHEDRSELIGDTSYVDYNPYRKRDSIAWRVIHLQRDSVHLQALQYHADSLCAAHYKEMGPAGCRLFHPRLNDSTLNDSILSDTAKGTRVAFHAALVLNNAAGVLPGWYASDTAITRKCNADSLAWAKQPDSVVVFWKKRNPNFDPDGRYVSLPIGQWVTRKHPASAWDSLALGSGLIGSRTILDQRLRPVRTDLYRHRWYPGNRLEYGDPHWPRVPTGVRTYVDSSGSQLRYRYTRTALDRSLGIATEAHAWKNLFEEPKADTLGLPGANPEEVTAAGAPDFVTMTKIDERGRPTMTIGPRKDTAEAEYDELSRVVRSRGPGGKWTSANYSDLQDGSGIVWTTSTGETGIQAISGVNGLGWPVISGVVSRDGRDSIISRQGFGVHGLQWAQDPEGRLATFAYDARGRPVWTSIEKSDGSAFRWRTSYDDLDRTATSVDPRGQATKTFFDLEGRPIRVERLVAGKLWSTESRYDNLGNLVWTRSPQGDTAHYEYNLQNLLVSARSAQGLSVASRYNWTGEPTRTARMGQGSGLLAGTSGGDSSALSWDGLGRLLGVDHLTDARMGQTLQWDARSGVADPGMLLGLTRATGAASSIAYDRRGSLVTRSSIAGMGNELKDTLSWQYLPDGRLQSQALPRGARIEYGWDGFDRLGHLSFIDPAGKRHTVLDTLVYGRGGQLDSVKLGNGVGERFVYEAARGLPVGVRLTGPTGRTLGERREAFDDAGRLTERTRLDGQKVYFRYDSLDRLTSVRYGTGKGDGTANYRYAWNEEGSRTGFVHDYGESHWSLGDSATASSNQVLSSAGSHDGTSLWGWDWKDGLGARRWQASASDTAVRESASYRWNAASELERFSRIARTGNRLDTNRLALSYGDHGLRAGKYRGSVAGNDTAWTLERRSVWDGPDVIADSSTGDSSWRYRIVLGLNALAEAERDSTGEWRLTWIVSDPVGSPEMLIDEQGQIVGRYAWGPFGELEDWQGSKATEFLFGGREWDGDLRASVFGYRLYDPEQGMFLSTDPMDQFWSPYSYVGGNPLAGVDPWGLEGSGGDRMDWNAAATAGGTGLNVENSIKVKTPQPTAQSKPRVVMPKPMANPPAPPPAPAAQASLEAAAVDATQNQPIAPAYEQHTGYQLARDIETPGVGLAFAAPSSVYHGIQAGLFATAIVDVAVVAYAGAANAAMREAMVAEMNAAGRASAFRSAQAGFHGTGPSPGSFVISSTSKSARGVMNYFPRRGSVEFVYDAERSIFIVGTGQKHSPLASAIGANPQTVVGGMFSRGPRGEFITNEYSGHFWMNWNDAVRSQFARDLGRYGIQLKHSR